jgi:hypothetical protein
MAITARASGGANTAEVVVFRVVRDGPAQGGEDDGRERGGSTFVGLSIG